ncbi:Biphenyl dioxygenase subunit alpha [Ruegeria denitrificans]|uniref:Biphenyl dioxygenase subunit alpha n=1 Tax=Ruegeria denitrificans TaxID=1715692 RepID=A0A0P1INT4_9RHOB|nr:SRPBCC family protein [Ruegeria denitrificans]CUK09646.1 Biphenyl dioxygenase subunit alpha [Ruegeria denitrificans]
MTKMYHHLPVEAYTSQEWFDREQRQIFSRSWRCAGLVEDIEGPGHYLSVQAGLNNLFIVMGRDHRLRAFHNICRHRGTQLIRAVGKAQKALTCPYHDWTYDLEGNLISVPDEASEFPNGVDKSCHGLKPASVDVWRGMLFVHPDPDAPTLAEWLGEVDPLLGPHKPEELVEYTEGRNSYEIKANWKIVVENYIDVYHLSHLHSNTLHMYDHAKAEYGWKGPHYHFWEPPSEGYARDLESNLPMPRTIPEPHTGAWVPMLFPGIGIGASEESWNLFIITPLAPDLTRIENRTKLANASDWAFQKQQWKSWSFWKDFGGPKYQGDDTAGADDPMASGDFTTEDTYACEQQQKSLKSPYLEIGPAGVGESPITQHQKAVLNFMQDS